MRERTTERGRSIVEDSNRMSRVLGCVGMACRPLMRGERQRELKLQDPAITEYVNRVGQNLVRNSDAKVPHQQWLDSGCRRGSGAGECHGSRDQPHRCAPCRQTDVQGGVAERCDDSADLCRWTCRFFRYTTGSGFHDPGDVSQIPEPTKRKPITSDFSICTRPDTIRQLR